MIFTHLVTDWLDAARARECTQLSGFLYKSTAKKISMRKSSLRNGHKMRRNLFNFSAFPSSVRKDAELTVFMRAHTLSCVLAPCL